MVLRTRSLARTANREPSVAQISLVRFANRVIASCRIGLLERFLQAICWSCGEREPTALWRHRIIIPDRVLPKRWSPGAVSASSAAASLPLIWFVGSRREFHHG